MSDDEIDKEIAEFCGWKLEPLAGREFNGIPVMVWVRPDGERGFPIPCYSADLNAIHEAEKLLADRWDGFHFRNHLCNNIHAAARQRAEAFLKTIGKWRDE